MTKAMPMDAEVIDKYFTHERLKTGLRVNAHLILSKLEHSNTRVKNKNGTQ